MSNELVVLTSYFNPMRYRRRRNNYDVFMADMRKVTSRKNSTKCRLACRPVQLMLLISLAEILLHDCSMP